MEFEQRDGKPISIAFKLRVHLMLTFEMFRGLGTPNNQCSVLSLQAEYLPEGGSSEY